MAVMRGDSRKAQEAREKEKYISSMATGLIQSTGKKYE